MTSEELQERVELIVDLLSRGTRVVIRVRPGDLEQAVVDDLASRGAVVLTSTDPGAVAAAMFDIEAQR